MTPEAVHHAPRPTPTSVIPAKAGIHPPADRVRHQDTGSSPSRPPGHPHLRHSRERRPLNNRHSPSFPQRRESIPDRVRHHDTGTSPSRPPAHPHLRHSREGGNPSPTGCATMTPEPVRHAPGATPTSMYSADMGVWGWRWRRHMRKSTSRERGLNPSPRPGCATMKPEPVLRHARRATRKQAGIHPRQGGATMTPEPVHHARSEEGRRRATPTSVIAPRTRESIPDRVRHHDTGTSPPRPPAHPHLRHSREGGNPSPTGCATMTPEPVRHARRATPTSVIPANAGIHPPTGCATMTPEPVHHARRATPTSVIPANAGIHPPTGCATMTPEPVHHAPRPTPTSVIPAKAGIHPPTGCATMTPEPVHHAPRPTPTSVIPAKAGIHPPRRRATMTPEPVRHAPGPIRCGIQGPFHHCTKQHNRAILCS